MNNDFLKIYEELDNLTEDSDKKRENSLDLSEADLKKLDKYFKEKLFEYNNEFEDEYKWGPGFYTDEINYNLEYKNDKYFLELTVYHASEDNNAENEDYFTDYYDEEYDTIEDFYAEYPEIVENLFKAVKDDLEDDELGEGIIFSDKAIRCQIKDLLNTENQFILNRLQAGRFIDDNGVNRPYRLSSEELEKLKDEYIYYEDDGDCCYARFEKPTNEIRELLGLEKQSTNPFDIF